MTVPTDNNIPVKECNLEKKIEKKLAPEIYHRATNNGSTGYDQERGI